MNALNCADRAVAAGPGKARSLPEHTPRRKHRAAGEGETLREAIPQPQPQPLPLPQPRPQPPGRYLGSQVPAVLRRLLLAGGRALPGSLLLLLRQLPVLGRLPAAGEQTPHGAAAAAAAARRGEAGEGLASSAPRRPAPPASGFPPSPGATATFPPPSPSPSPPRPAPTIARRRLAGRCLQRAGPGREGQRGLSPRCVSDGHRSLAPGRVPPPGPARGSGSGEAAAARKPGTEVTLCPARSRVRVQLGRSGAKRPVRYKPTDPAPRRFPMDAPARCPRDAPPPCSPPERAAPANAAFCRCFRAAETASGGRRNPGILLFVPPFANS